jgi:hypothetical protein
MSGDKGRSARQQFHRDELFRLARLPDGEDDGGRAHAIRALGKLRQRQIKVGETDDWQLEDLFKGLSVRIHQSKDCAETAKNLRGKGRKRGPKAKYERRDFDLAVEVDRYILQRRSEGVSPGKWQDKTFEDAIEKIAEAYNLEADRLRKIVLEQRRKHSKWGIRAEAAFHELWELSKLSEESTTEIATK